MRVKEALGMVPNLAAGMAESPNPAPSVLRGARDLLAGHAEPGRHPGAVADQRVRERLRVVHGISLRRALKAGLPKEALEDLRDGRAPRDPRLRALSVLSRAWSGIAAR